MNSQEGSVLVCDAGHGVSTGSGSDRVTVLAKSTVGVDRDPVATAPGTDLIPKLRHYTQEIRIDGLLHERLESCSRRCDLPDGGRASSPRAARNKSSQRI